MSIPISSPILGSSEGSGSSMSYVCNRTSSCIPNCAVQMPALMVGQSGGLAKSEAQQDIKTFDEVALSRQ